MTTKTERARQEIIAQYEHDDDFEVDQFAPVENVDGGSWVTIRQWVYADDGLSDGS